MSEFIGRYTELEELNRRYKSLRKEFGVVYGRRRIGKSALLNKFLEDKWGLMFQAKRDNLYGNLKSFSYELNKILGLPKNYVFNSYQEAFDTLEDHINDKKFVLIIDEYPYILEQDNSFSSVLQELFDKAPDNLLIIISGSDVSLLKNEILNHASPLYKRRTFEMEIKSLPYREACEFLKDFPRDDKFNYLSLFSTYPYYLSSLNKTLSFEDNVQSLLFNQYGTFFALPDQLLSNSTQVQDVYNAILNAIAHRKRTNKEISIYIHEEEAKVSKYLTTLLESEMVIRCTTFMGNKKSTYYEIGDSLLRFWYYFIFNNQERIKINGIGVYTELKEEINHYLSYGFEDICKTYMNQLNADGALESIFPRFQTYKVEHSKINRSIELDGVAESQDILCIVECKYRQEPFDQAMLEHLKESATVFPDKLKRVYYIFSKSGFTENIYKNHDANIHLYTLEEMI